MPAPRPAPSTADPQATTPRWVKVLAIAAAVLVVLLLVQLLAGGSHGPGRHLA